MRTVRFLVPTDAAVVLGSTQPESHVDRAAAAAAGLAVARRASGGGAVLVGPGRVLWVDVVVPVGDDLWDADVRRAFWWLGDVWAEAVKAIGLPGSVGIPGPGPVVWHGGLVTSAWSRRVCFAGLGPGEVTIDGAKVVGLSQRRTRAGAHFQCAALLEWDPMALLDALDLDPAARRRGHSDLAGVAQGVGRAAAPALKTAFLAQLP